MPPQGRRGKRLAGRPESAYAGAAPGRYPRASAVPGSCRVLVYDENPLFMTGILSKGAEMHKIGRKGGRL